MRRLAVALGCGLLILGALAWLFWLGPLASARPDYRGTGFVLALLPPPSDLHATRPVIVIHHDPIPDLMDESMSMPFIAASTDLFKGIEPGDRIAFGMAATDDALLVISIERVGLTTRR